jgi:hypothetical protein
MSHYYEEDANIYKFMSNIFPSFVESISEIKSLYVTINTYKS